MTNIKQVIVIRADLKMRRGKEIAQGSHASMKFLVDKIKAKQEFTQAEQAWLDGSFKKICVRVDNELDLLEVHRKAIIAGIQSSLICDSGATEFGGVPTNTAVAIGPDYSEKIDQITGELRLY